MPKERMTIIMANMLSLVVGIVGAFQSQINSMKLQSVDGVYMARQGYPSPEERQKLDLEGFIPGWKMTYRRSRSAGSSWITDKNGIYRGQNQPEDGDPDLLHNEGHHNSSQIMDNDHVYYTSKIYGPGDPASRELWVDFDGLEGDRWKVHGFLSTSHRHAVRVNLSFDFPFYGHMLKEITVATGGFIYTGDVIHRMLTATQYIAPLMANFDPSLSENSSVFYFDNGTALVAQWNRVYLQDGLRLGTFTFQTTLHSDGRIVFAYKEIPVDINDISGENHPVKVGLSDAFVILHKIEQIPNVRRRMVYEYHKVDILKSKISNSTAVEIHPLPTCLQFSSCGTCVTSQIGFNCSWCHRLQRCSSGFDRNRQDWVDLGCLEERRDLRCILVRNFTKTKPGVMHTTAAIVMDTTSTGSTAEVPTSSTTGSAYTLLVPARSTQDDTKVFLHLNEPPGEVGNTDVSQERLQTGLLAGIILAMILLATVVLLSAYMYNHPTSSASLFFMERRPTRWPIMTFRRGSGNPSYCEVEAAGLDRDSMVVIDPKQSFIISGRRESDLKEGFLVPDQRECFLFSDSS